MKPIFETKLGKLYQGDCLEVMRKLDLSNVSLVITDPPYNKISTNGGGIYNRKKSITHHLKIKEKELDKFEVNLFAEILYQRLSIFHAYIFTGRYDIVKWLNFAENKDLSYDLLVMVKKNPIPAYNNVYMSDREFIVFLREKGKCFFNKKLPDYNIYRGAKQIIIGFKKEKNSHPTQKPIQIIRDFIRVSSQEGDLILDPFLGSGTTAIACEELNRRWVGIEIDKEYCDIAIDRIKKVASQQKLF